MKADGEIFLLRKRKRICLIATSKLIVRFFLVDIINCLAERYEVYLVVSNDRQDVDLSCLRAEIFYLRIERKISPFYDIFALYRLCRLLRILRPDVVHSISPKGGLLGMVAAFIARVPVRLHIFTGQVWVSRNGIMRRVLKCADRVVAAFATSLLADSKSQRDFLVAEHVVSSDRIGVLCSGSVAGVDVSRFKPSPDIRHRIRKRLNISENAFVFLYTGRMNRDKGVLDLGQAFLQMAQCHPDIYLILVGPDEEGIFGQLTDIASMVAGRLHCVDYTPRIESYIVAADVLCLPSYREGFGTVIIEAAAAGVTAIASDIYGIRDAVVDGDTGILVPPGDVYALTCAMAELAADMVWVRKMGQRAMKRAREKFSSGILKNAWIDYYERLCPAGDD